MVRSNRPCDLSEYPCRSGGMVSWMRRGGRQAPMIDSEAWKLPIRSAAMVDAFDQSEVDPGISELAGDRRNDRHGLKRLIERRAIALHLLPDLLQGILTPERSGFVEDHEVGEIEAASFSKLAPGTPALTGVTYREMSETSVIASSP